MKPPGRSALISLLALTTTSLHAQTSTTNPLQHFKNEWDLGGVTKIYKLEVDINNDGLKEVFLSTGKSDPPGTNELAWVLYVAKPGGQYVLAGEKTDTGVRQNAGVGFKKDQYWIGLIPEVNRYGLLYLSCGRGGQAKCQLMAIVIEGDAFEEIAIGQPVSAETNAEQLAQRFSDPPTPIVQEVAP
jgi:hypothetical protein